MRAGEKSLAERARAELAKRELARRHYADYLRYVNAPGWIDTRFSRFLARETERFAEEQTGHSHDILLIETPPQHGKSSTVTEAFPSWYLGRHPERRVILAAYNTPLAERFCRRNREKLALYGQNLFALEPGSTNQAREFELAGHRGGLMARGILAGITGNPADLILLDDPIKNRQEADSGTRRQRIWEEWQSSLKSRLAAGGKVIVIMTPWREDDFAAQLLASEPNARLLRLPVEAEEGDPLGRSPGEALCPELGKDEAWLRDFRKGYLTDPAGGRRAWAALYQCAPRTEQGNLVPRRWWRYYSPGREPELSLVLLSVDAAFKDGEQNDFVCIQVWGKRGEDYYLLDCLNRHMDFPATVAAIRTMRRRFPQARAVLIEDKANGSAIIQTLQQEMPCIPVNPQGGKVSRVQAVSLAIEAGHVFLPELRECAWTEEFVEQFAAFPNGRHDDMVDAATQALQRLLPLRALPVRSGEEEESPAEERDIFTPF